MTNKCETLTEMMENSKGSFSPDEDDFSPVFHELYENDDFGGMKKLLNSFAKFRFRTKNYETYAHAFVKARDDLDSFTEEAEALFGGKGIIREFYREAVDYSSKISSDIISMRSIKDNKQNQGFPYNFSPN